MCFNVRCIECGELYQVHGSSYGDRNASLCSKEYYTERKFIKTGVCPFCQSKLEECICLL